MNGYVDAAHYTRRIGNVVALCALRNAPGCHQYDMNFSDASGLLKHLRDSRKALDRYMELHSADLADLRQEVRETHDFRDHLPPTGAEARHQAQAIISRLDVLKN
jgi:hypothetical protein